MTPPIAGTRDDLVTVATERTIARKISRGFAAVAAARMSGRRTSPLRRQGNHPTRVSRPAPEITSATALWQNPLQGDRVLLETRQVSDARRFRLCRITAVFRAMHPRVHEVASGDPFAYHWSLAIHGRLDFIRRTLQPRRADATNCIALVRAAREQVNYNCTRYSHPPCAFAHGAPTRNDESSLASDGNFLGAAEVSRCYRRPRVRRAAGTNRNPCNTFLRCCSDRRRWSCRLGCRTCN